MGSLIIPIGGEDGICKERRSGSEHRRNRRERDMGSKRRIGECAPSSMRGMGENPKTDFLYGIVHINASDDGMSAS